MKPAPQSSTWESPKPSSTLETTQAAPVDAGSPALQVEIPEEVETLTTSIKAGTVAQVVVAMIAIIGLLYIMKLVLVTALTSMLVAYVLEPAVGGLVLMRMPRWVAALIVVLLALALAGGITYFSLNRVVAFADQLPHYSARVRDVLGGVLDRANQIEEHAREMVEPARGPKQTVPVKVEQAGGGVTQILTENGGTILDILLAVGFVPFLVYFMLASKDHFHVATVRLFSKEHRLLAHRTVGTISSMIRSYIAANVVVGILNAVICMIIFWILGIQYFYFIGAITGFLSLIPYLGTFLSLVPPLAAGLDTLNKTGLLAVVASVIGLHLITMNVVYPKFIGEKLKLNALAVSLSLLFWAWIWGAMGLVLAIPLLGAAKIICDHIDPLGGLGTWLGESNAPRSA
jgi:predicted PurR-regulated permease PerM